MAGSVGVECVVIEARWMALSKMGRMRVAGYPQAMRHPKKVTTEVSLSEKVVVSLNIRLIIPMIKPRRTPDGWAEWGGRYKYRFIFFSKSLGCNSSRGKLKIQVKEMRTFSTAAKFPFEFTVGVHGGLKGHPCLLIDEGVGWCFQIPKTLSM